MKRFVTLTLLCGLSICGLSACATTAGKAEAPVVTAGKSLLALKEIIVGTREAITVPCQQGIIPVDACRQMDDWYNQSKSVYDAAVDAEILALRGGSETDLRTAGEKQAQLAQLASQIAALALRYHVQGGVK